MRPYRSRKTSELDNLKSAIHDILADKTESDIYSLDPKNMQRLEYLYRSPGMLYDFNDYIKQLATANNTIVSSVAWIKQSSTRPIRPNPTTPP